LPLEPYEIVRNDSTATKSKAAVPENLYQSPIDTSSSTSSKLMGWSLAGPSLKLSTSATFEPNSGIYFLTVTTSSEKL